MNAPRLFVGALACAVLGTGCHRDVSRAEVKQSASDAAAELKVKGAQARDELADLWLSTKIHSKFAGDRDISARDISVASENGVVTLKGKVLNEPRRQLALAIARNTDGVKQVVDELSVETAGPLPLANNEDGATPGAVATSGTVDPNAGPLGDDARITAMIQSKYFRDDRIKGRHIDVTSHAGVVTLNGEVADDTERAQALLLARTTDGVTRVEDGLTVAGSGTSTNAPGPTDPADGTASPAAKDPAYGGAAAAASADDALVGRVRSQLSADAQVKGTSLEVSAKNGVVLLQGTVANAAAKDRALSVARSTDGVTQVIDRIQVGKARR